MISIALFISSLYLLLLPVFIMGLNDITVKPDGNSDNIWSCILTFQNQTFPCAYGRNGVILNKVEGDGCTPIGSYPLRRVFYRSDRINNPNLPDFIPTQITIPSDGWVDDANSTLYNQYVTLPSTNGPNSYNSYENLYLDAASYDLMAVIGYNDDPIIPNKGSAIFFHVASIVTDTTNNTTYLGPTAGCVSLSIENLTYVLSNVQPDTTMHISN